MASQLGVLQDVLDAVQAELAGQIAEAGGKRDVAYLALRTPHELSVEEVRNLYRQYWSECGRSAGLSSALRDFARVRDCASRLEDVSTTAEDCGQLKR
jgi:hypothetical protein